MLTENLPRVPIAHLPTPLEEMSRLSEALGGPRLFVKRDDQTGLATGGNKARKLEFLLAEALEKESDTVITAGAVQSNHARQTAAAAAKFGLRCCLVLGGESPDRWTGNLLLDELLGAEIRWAGERERSQVMEEVAEEEKRAGRHPYIIPYGGSNPVGAAGYVAAMEELMGQLAERDLQVERVVFPSSSGGTQSGLIVGAKALGFAGRIEGISVDKTKEVLKTRLEELVTETTAHLGLDLSFVSQDFIVHDDYLGEGYARIGPPEREAIRLSARTEGLLVGPVYTGRAMAGLMDLIRRGVFGKDETILFWHTGGTPALFAYADELLR
ncbi:MAG: D-cysteine desulfhydrase family protein [Anaerolineae bacterium]